MPDRFVWKWIADGVYTTSSAYRAFFIGSAALPGARLVWRAATPPKVKFFFWLALHGRLWTADRRHRHGLQPHATCILCNQDVETADHLLTVCPFTREVWARLLIRSDLLQLTPTADDSLANWWLNARDLVPAALKRAFDSAVITVTWVV